MFTQIDHLAFTVKDLNQAVGLYTSSYNLECTLIEIIEDLKTKIAFIPVGDVLLELLQPTEPGTDLDKFIREKGETFHHIAYRVQDLDASIKELKKTGMKIMMGPRPGGKGARIAFLDPASSGNILTELVERKE